MSKFIIQFGNEQDVFWEVIRAGSLASAKVKATIATNKALNDVTMLEIKTPEGYLLASKDFSGKRAVWKGGNKEALPIRYIVNTEIGLNITSNISRYKLVTECTRDNLEATLCKDIINNKYVHACEATYDNAGTLYSALYRMRSETARNKLGTPESNEFHRVFYVAKAIWRIDHYCNELHKQHLYEDK